MKKVLTLVIFALFIGNSIAQNVHKDFYDGKIYLKFKNTFRGHIPHNGYDVDLRSFYAFKDNKSLISEFGITEVIKPFHQARSLELQLTFEITFTHFEKVYDLIKVLEQNPDVEYAEQVPIMKTTFTPNDLGPNTTTNTGVWHLYRINAQQAWDLSQGSSAIKIAIVDDAVLVTHQDLAGKIWTNPGEIPGNGIDDDGNGYIDDVNGWDASTNTNNPMPTSVQMSHGTHVAGIAGAHTNNNVGVASIGFNVSLIPVKSTNNVNTVSHAFAGVVYATNAGADVINMSWGGNGFSQTGQNIMNNAANAGIVLVAAAGNDNSSQVFYPAGYNHVIAVASTTTNDAKSNFSNFGTYIDISAPGSAIRSTYTGNSLNVINAYNRIQGTSMASPLVAGLCGLMLSLNPNLTPTQVKNCLLSTADDISAANPTQYTLLGAGRINAYAAMQCVASTVNSPPVAVIGANQTIGCPGAVIQFNGSSLGGLATSYSWSFPGGTPSTSTQQNPTVTYAANGTYSVSLTVANQFGNNTTTEQNFITISNAGEETFFFEGFEGANFAATGWTVENPDNSITWELFTVGGTLQGTRAARVNHFNYQATGQRDGLISPIIDLSQNSDIKLTFEHAHRRFSADYRDSLIIFASTNGGTTWPFRLFAAAENGQGTFATGSILNQNFVPASAADWCFGGSVGATCFTIDLSNFDGATNFRLKFETWNGYGNNTYIDNIQLIGKCTESLAAPPTAAFNSNKTTICQGESIVFTDASTGNPTSVAWTFQGGIPSTSSNPVQQVTFNTPGTYTITLTATNAWGSNSTTQTIVVNANPQTPTITQNGNTLIANPSGLSYQWFGPNGLIQGATSQTFTPTVAGNYSVQVTNNNGCKSTSNNFEFKPDISSVFELKKVDFRFFPNPASEVVYINTPEHFEGKMVNVEVINTIGQIVQSQSKLHLEKLIILNVSSLQTGIYFLRISTGNEIFTGKLNISQR